MNKLSKHIKYVAVELESEEMPGFSKVRILLDTGNEHIVFIDPGKGVSILKSDDSLSEDDAKSAIETANLYYWKTIIENEEEELEIEEDEDEEELFDEIEEEDDEDDEDEDEDELFFYPINGNL